MNDAQVIAAKRALSHRRVDRFKAMPESQDEWMKQMDTVSEATGIPNVYRSHPHVGMRRINDE